MKKSIFFLAAFFLSSCANIAVTIDSMGNMPKEGRKYFLICYSPDCRELDLEYQEIASCVEDVLGRKGYRRVASVGESEEIVAIFYGFDAHSYQSAIPVLSGPQKSTFSAYNSDSGYTTGSVATPGQTTYVPVSGTNFTSLIAISAHEKSGNEAPQRSVDLLGKQLWITRIFGSSTANNMRRMFPVLLVGAQEYIGKDTRGDYTLSLQPRDVDCGSRTPSSSDYSTNQTQPQSQTKKAFLDGVMGW